MTSSGVLALCCFSGATQYVMVLRGRLAAAPVVLADAAAPEVAGRGQLHIQPVPLVLQLGKRGLGHGQTPSGCLIRNRLRRDQDLFQAPTFASHTRVPHTRGAGIALAV